MPRTISPERQELRAEASRLRQAGWGQLEISRALAIPRQTINRWITGNGVANAECSESIMGRTLKDRIAHNGASPIILFPRKYEDVGDGIAPGSVDLILTDPPYLASSNNLSRTLQNRKFKDYYLPEEKRVCPRCAGEKLK